MGRKDKDSGIIHAEKNYGVQEKVFINMPREIEKAGQIRAIHY